MKKYTYCFIRYIYDRVKGEFVNVGIVLHTPEDRYLGCRFLESTGFVKRLFNGLVDDNKLKSILGNIEKIIDDKAEALKKELEFERNDIVGILNSLFPKENGAIEISNVMGGLVDDSEKRLKELYLDYVDRNTLKRIKVNTTDRDIYASLTAEARKNKLKIDRKTIGAKSFSQEFRAIQNGRLHAIGAASFDCETREDIEKKAFLYHGLFNWIKEVDSSDCLFHLVVAPPTNKEFKKTADEAKKFIKNSSLPLSIIEDNQLPEFIKELAVTHNK